MASAAKQAVQNFIGNHGHHKTTVNEEVAPAVTNETVKPHRHENVTTAIDKEVHQDHHHTTVQPINHREILPEEHSHNALPTQHKTFEHGNAADVRAKLDHEAAKFKNTSTTHQTSHSSTTAPTVEGERIHHHVHEHVQPVIQKETVQPSVVHTTVPIHETHHAAAQHHGTSTLPAKTLDEFRSAGGVLDGKSAAHHGEYDGCPRPYNKNLQTEQTEADRDFHEHSHHLGGTGHGATGTGVSASAAGAGIGSKVGHSHRRGSISSSDDEAKRTTSGTNGTKKPGLMARLNPKRDADGDGKAGFMD